MSRQDVTIHTWDVPSETQQALLPFHGVFLSVRSQLHVALTFLSTVNGASGEVILSGEMS